MGSFSGESWSSSVMILKHREEGRLITDVRDVLVVEIVQAVDEAIRAAVQADQRCLVVGHVEAVLPDGGLECLWPVVLKGADAEVVVVGAVQGVLIAPGPIKIARFEKTGEAGVGAVPPEGGLIFFVEVAPVAAGKSVLLLVGCPARGLGHFGDAEVVVGVFERAGDGARQCAEAFPVEILDGDVTESMPAVEATASLAAPIERLDFGIFDNSGVAILPLRITKLAWMVDDLDRIRRTLMPPLRPLMYASASTTSAFEPPYERLSEESSTLGRLHIPVYSLY